MCAGARGRPRRRGQGAGPGRSFRGCSAWWNACIANGLPALDAPGADGVQAGALAPPVRAWPGRRRAPGRADPGRAVRGPAAALFSPVRHAPLPLAPDRRVAGRRWAIQADSERNSARIGRSRHRVGCGMEPRDEPAIGETGCFIAGVAAGREPDAAVVGPVDAEGAAAAATPDREFLRAKVAPSAVRRCR